MAAPSTRIDLVKLQEHIEDFQSVAKQTTSSFICPITLQPVAQKDLINGHILNKAFTLASNRTLIQNGVVDGFYGTTAEPSFIKFMNRSVAAKAAFLKSADRLKINLPGGESVDAFMPNQQSAKHAEKIFPSANLSQEGQSLCSLFVKVPLNDPRLVAGTYEVETIDTAYPSHWVASMVKAAYLAAFDLLGYSAVYSAWGLFVRNALNGFAKTKGKSSDATYHFRPFRNCVKFLLNKDLSTASIDFDTLDHRQCLLHSTMSDTIFAITYIFKINGTAIMVTLPVATAKSDAAISSDYYEKLMETPSTVKQKVRPAVFKGTKWEVNTNTIGVTYEMNSQQVPPMGPTATD